MVEHVISNDPVQGQSFGRPATPGMRMRQRLGSWAMQIGIALMFLGALAFCSLAASPSGSALLSGWIIVLAGAVEVLHAFRLRRRDSFFLHLVPGIAAVPIGLLIAAHPAANAFSWMLLFAAVFTIVGSFRILSAARLKFTSWPWAVFDGSVTLLLGSVLWAAWTWLGTWFFASAAGISLLARGWSWVMFAQRVSNRARSTAPPLAGPRKRECSAEASAKSSELVARSSFSFAAKIHNQR